MTRKEAIKILENEKKCVKRAEYCDRQCGKCELVKEDKIILKTFDMAIEALEQEPNDKYIKEIDHLHKYIAKLETRIVEQDSVLDDVSAEIEEIETYDGIYIDRAYVLQIVDKYKAESEVTNDRRNF